MRLWSLESCLINMSISFHDGLCLSTYLFTRTELAQWPQPCQGTTDKSLGQDPDAQLSLSSSDQIRSDQSLSRVWLLATPWIAARQASLSITNSRSSLRLSPYTTLKKPNLKIADELLRVWVLQNRWSPTWFLTSMYWNDFCVTS